MAKMITMDKILILVIMVGGTSCVGNELTEKNKTGQNIMNIGCENTTVALRCEANTRILVASAVYGQEEGSLIGTKPVLESCSSRDAPYYVASSLCDGRDVCYIYASSSTMEDKCPGYSKYLNVSYTCHECENSNGDDKLCDKKARNGECTSNKAWMYSNCFLSCSGCNDSVSCENIYRNCDTLASQDRCVTERNWMMTYCRKSCRACNGDVTRVGFEGREYADGKLYRENAVENGNATLSCPSSKVISLQYAFYGIESGSDNCSVYGTFDTISTLCDTRNSCSFDVSDFHLGHNCRNAEKKLNSEYLCTECENLARDASCDDWMRKEECAINPIWMYANCYKSCSHCEFTDACYNLKSDDYCDEWARKGECNANKVWMSQNCMKSCNLCKDNYRKFDKPKDPPADSNVVVGCERQTISLTCDNDKRIKIFSSIYGRTDETTCTTDTTACNTTSKSYDKLSKLCDGRKSCEIHVNNNYGNPCPDLPKFLNITYSCVKCENLARDASCDDWMRKEECAINPIWMYANCYKSCSHCEFTESCENEGLPDTLCDDYALRGYCWSHEAVWMSKYCRKSCGLCEKIPKIENGEHIWLKTSFYLYEGAETFIKCPQSYQLNIVYAKWGRNPTEHCVYDCTTKNVTNVLESKCNTKPDCSINALSGLLGDPCPGIPKVLEVSYTCDEYVYTEVACEQETAHMECFGDDQVEVKSAKYGLSVDSCIKSDVASHKECEPHDITTDVSNLCDEETGKKCSVKNNNSCDISVDYTCRECKNHYRDCDIWMYRGDCDLNPSWMHAYCYKACSKCDRLKCKNQLPNCDDMMSKGDCEMNPIYMYRNCYKSCSKCDM